MSWFLLAILSPMIYAAVNFADKFIVKGVINDYHGMPIYSAINNLIYGSFFWALSGFPVLDFKNSIFIISTGIISVCASFLYFKAIYNEVTSKVVILLQIVPLFVLGLSVTFLKEALTIKEIIGFILILLATTGLVLPKKSGLSRRLSFSNLLIILTACLLWAVSSILLKVAVSYQPVKIIFIYQSWGISLGGLIIFIMVSKIRNSFLKGIKTVGVLSFILVFINEGFFIIGKILNLLALAQGPVSLVSIMGNTQAFFGIIFGRFLSTLAPSIYEEEKSSIGLGSQIIFATVMFIGILFL